MYKEIIRPTLDCLNTANILPSGKAHNLTRNFFDLCEKNPLTLKLFEKIFADSGKRFTNKRLETTLGNIQLDNFLMVGAGWTKTGQAVQTLWTIGAAAVVVGGVVLNKQRGNEGKTQDMFTSGVSWKNIKGSC